MKITLPWEIKREIIIRAEDETSLDYGCLPEKRPIQQYIRCGIINLDKPSGPTSHEVVAWIRKILNLEHAGHGGTLEIQVEEIPR